MSPFATILFVGGNLATQAALAGTLRQAGFGVKEAATGPEAFDLARQDSELILFAGNLPDVSDGEFCRRVKAELTDVPLLRLVDAAPEGEAAGGADGCLVRPVGAPDLLLHVQALLRMGRAEAALQASEARLHDILDRAPVVAYLKDLTGHYRFVNRLWEKRFRLDRARVLGQCALQVHGAERAEALLANDLRVLQGGAPLEFEEVVAQDDGPHTYYSLKFALFDAAGKPYATCGISTDITARKRAEEALRESEALYHSLVESLPVCLLRKDLTGRFTFANKAFCAALRKLPEQVVGKTDFDFYPAEMAAKYVHDDRRVIGGGEILEDIEEHRDPEGAPTYVQTLKAPLRDARGQVVGVQAIYWDVTPRKRAEAEVSRSAAEFRVARRIQQKLFPTSVPHLPGMDIAVGSFGFDISGASYPAEAIGGDYYDFVPLGEGGLGVAIGDVSGHGVGPALMMAEVRAFLRAFAHGQEDVGAILGLVNRLLIPDIEDDRFVTLLLARLDPRSRLLTYASAGQHPGHILNPAGEVRCTLESTSTPIGIFKDNTFPSSPPIELAPGDLILLVTDGVSEAAAPDGTRFGTQRALDLVRFYRREPAREIVENLYQAVRAFSHNMPQYDDITATVIKVTG
jgi:sigma-B regulation protein RsbU (phosphoserine phosphatase)